MVGQGDSQTRFRFAPRPVRGAKRASKPPPESQCISMARLARRQPERPRRRIALQVSSFFLVDGILKAAHGFACARIVHRKFNGGFVMPGKFVWVRNKKSPVRSVGRLLVERLACRRLFVEHLLYLPGLLLDLSGDLLVGSLVLQARI